MKLLTMGATAWNNGDMKRNVILLGTVLLIVLAIALVSLLSRTGSSTSETDVRARAAATKALQLVGTVASADDAKGIVVIDNAYLADENRVGEAKNMGSWTVTAPGTFNFASVSPGQQVIINIDSKTFLIESHTVTALAIVPVK